MKRKIFILAIISMVVFSPVASVHAEELVNSPQTVGESLSVQRSDVIVTKYRVSHGVLQYRRWNETRGYWVDDDWITVG